MDAQTKLKLQDGSRVAVMGGGPAGSFFSYFLLDMAGRAGKKIHVDIYEPRDFTIVGPPGCNMCGGIISESLVQMLATEGIAVSGIGLIVGLALGGIISLILIDVVNRQSFHWSMDFAVPWTALAGFALAVLALASATAVASGRRAMGEDVVRAVKEDW